jgi:ureidoglycolate hydrolase
MRPESLSQRKIPMTALGFETAGFQLVAYYLNQMHHRIPSFVMQYTEFTVALFAIY